jgi:dipeptidyl aminopeptidase/acylaminoacyl peptidase
MMQVLDLKALLQVPYVDPYTGLGLSPDGRQIAFSWNPTGRWEIYTMPLDGSTPPRQITSGPGGKFGPRWSPDGGHLAYTVDLEGSELYDVYVYDFVADRHTNLTPDTAYAINPTCCWSPDGRWIAFGSDRSGHFDTYVMPFDQACPERSRRAHGTLASGGAARQVLSLEFLDREVSWSPDGQWLAVVAEARAQDYWTFIVPAHAESPLDEPGAVRVISDGNGPICAKDACWSPDSARLAFCSNAHDRFEVGLYELATGQITWVTGGEGDKEQVAWSPDGERLAYVGSRGPVTELALLELGDGSLATYQVGQGVHYAPHFTPDGSRLVFVFDNPAHPCDVWLLELAGGALRQLTQSLPPDLRAASFVMPAQVRYPSLDGQSVPALLYQPPSQVPVPAVVYVHGGPNWLTQVTWDPLVQHMVSRGWAVLAPNYRGSTGYGRAWQLANRFDLGGGDTKDVVAGADYLVREGIADPARVAVSGRSWGGYLTMTSLTQYPDRWAAGAAVVPFLNWFTGHANSRHDLQRWDLENFGDPEKDYDLYYERSPFFFLDRITAPVQMICGAHDIRCPATESTQAHDALVAQGKPCDLVLYPDEGHSFLKSENVVDAKTRRVAFLTQALEGEKSPS